MNGEQATIFNRALSPKLVGAMFMLLWALSLSTAMALAKKLSPEIETIILLFMRCFFGLVFVSPFIIQTGLRGFTTSRPILHLFRVLCLVIGMGCTFYAYRNLELSVATSIGMTGPLFTIVLSMIFLKEDVSLSKWALIFFGYIGVLVIVRPHELPVSTGVWVELLANFFAGLSVISMKLLSRTESTLTLMLYANTATTFLTGLFAISVWKMPLSHDLVLLILIGACGFFSQYCSIMSLRHANPSFLAPFEYTRLCFAVPVGYFFFHEYPSLWTFWGSIIIIGSTYGLTRLELTSRSPQ